MTPSIVTPPACNVEPMSATPEPIVGTINIVLTDAQLLDLVRTDDTDTDDESEED